ncbi:hypothetical protein J2Z75_002599 [Rhizobium herbae]|uniref:Uncharacterized protein n=1 Tax=Rhizobium herbae TaxID=508661 RepID=A0ABS4EMB8_9HYPH|nr:hypothetical protein [Rhizobium herbae]
MRLPGFIRVPGNLGLTVPTELLLQLDTFCHRSRRRHHPRIIGGSYKCNLGSLGEVSLSCDWYYGVGR